MKAAIVSKDDDIEIVEKELKRFGFELVNDNPDFVVSYGGDGTFLIAERKYPGVPKLLVKNSQRCYKCHNLPISEALAFIKIGKYKIEELIKLEARINNEILIGVNDVVIRNLLPIHALRFSLEVDRKLIEEELVGDGLLVSTVFGSTAYFYSITKTEFKNGIGIAFINLHGKKDFLILDENVEIKIKVMRGNGVLCSDNNSHVINLDTDEEEIIIKKSKEKCRIIVI